MYWLIITLLWNQCWGTKLTRCGGQTVQLNIINTNIWTDCHSLLFICTFECSTVCTLFHQFTSLFLKASIRNVLFTIPMSSSHVISFSGCPKYFNKKMLSDWFRGPANLKFVRSTIFKKIVVIVQASEGSFAIAFIQKLSSCKRKQPSYKWL